jgi:two-component system chemotaxis response regulator CheY
VEVVLVQQSGTDTARARRVIERKLNILTVDDELPVTWSIRFALSNADRALSSAGSGEEALTKVQAERPPFDIVITDSNMPRVNGLELVRRLREIQFNGKIIVVSAHLSDDVQRQYAALNVDGMLPKPFNVQDLRATVDLVAQAA